MVSWPPATYVRVEKEFRGSVLPGRWFHPDRRPYYTVPAARGCAPSPRFGQPSSHPCEWPDVPRVHEIPNTSNYDFAGCLLPIKKVLGRCRRSPWWYSRLLTPQTSG